LSEIQTKLCLAWFIARDTVPHTTAHRYSFQPLFYGALTRAIKQLYIITESPNYSPFLAHLNLNKINWQEYPILGDKSKYITIEIGNQKGHGSHPTIQIRDLLKAQGYIAFFSLLKYKSYGF
jgi:hypothetical protein